MKRILILVCMFFAILFNTSYAARVPENVREIPLDVYKEPYTENRYTTTYAPWLKLLHLMNESEYNSGKYAGEACQQIRNMAISPVNTDVMYFVTDTSGVWKTTTGGKHWYSTTNNIPRDYGVGLLCDVFDENVVYCYMAKSGAYKSVNGGKTWIQLLADNTTGTKSTSNLLAQDNKGNVYIAGENGIYFNEYGTNDVVNLCPEFIQKSNLQMNPFFDISVSGDGRVIAGAAGVSTEDKIKGGIYISRDYGKTWEIKNLFGSGETTAISVAIDPDDENHILVSAQKVNPEDGTKSDRGIYESFDCANTFKKLYVLTSSGEQGNSADEKLIYKVRFGPKNKNGIRRIYFCGWEIQYPHRMSDDGGKTFQTFYGRVGKGTFRQAPGSEGETGWFTQGYALDPYDYNRVIFACAGIYEWYDGEITWMTSGFSGASCTYMDMDEEGNILFGLTDVGTVISTTPYSNDSIPFFKIGDKTIVTKGIIDPNDSNRIIAFSGNSNSSKKILGIVISNDRGMTFGDIINGSESKVNTLMLKFDKSNSDIIYSSQATSYDRGETWIQNQYFYCDVSNKSDRIVAKEGSGASTKLLLSEDLGKTWRDVCTAGFDFTSCNFDINDDNKVWYTTLYDFGYFDLEKNEKVSLAARMDYRYYFNFAQNPKNDKHLIVVTRPNFGNNEVDPKIYESYDGGETFHAVPGFFGSYFQVAYFSKTTDEIFVTSHSGTFIYNYKIYKEYLDSKIKVKFNEKETSLQKMPKLLDGIYYIPLRDVCERLGAEVTWDNNKQCVNVKKGKDILLIYTSNDIVEINGESLQYEGKILLEEGYTFVPLKLITNIIDVSVGWDVNSRQVVIKEHK